MKNNLTEHIFIFAKKELNYRLIAGLVNFCLLVLVLWLSITLTDSIFFFSEVTRWGLLIINVMILIVLFYKLVFKSFTYWKDFSNKSDLTPTARKIGKIRPPLKDHLINLYQLSKLPAEKPLVIAAVEQISESIKETDFEKEIHLTDYLPRIKIITSIMLSSIFILTFQFSDIVNSTKRLLNPSNEYLKIPLYSFNVLPGNKNVLYNQPLDFKVEYIGPEADIMHLIIMDKEDKRRVIPLEKKKGNFSGRLKEVTESFQYVISAVPLIDIEFEGYLLSDKYEIGVLIPPRVQDLKIKVIPPAYSKNSAFFNENNEGNLTVLAGSEIQLNISSNKALQSVFLVMNDKDTLRLSNKGKMASGHWTARSQSIYKISLLDIEGLRNQNPINYSIGIIPDNPPYVDITEPGADIEARLEDMLKLKIDAADDYGLEDIYLKYRYLKKGAGEDSSWNNLKINDFKTGLTKAELYYSMDFSQFYVGFNDQIEYYAIAIDNNNVDGHSKSSSPVYKITFPSMDELFEEFSQGEDEKVTELEDLKDEAEKIKENLEELKRELSRSEQINWEQKKQIENTLEQQKAAQEKVEEIKKELEEMINKLDQNNLMSPEMIEKYNMLQELFNEIAPPELLEAMKKLQESMEKANPNDIKKALENFKLNQEAFQANLERTLELFKQVQLEQQIEQLVQQADNLRKTQEKISETLSEKEKLTEKEKEQVANEQSAQQEQLNALERNLDQLINKEQLQKFSEAKQNLSEAKETMQQNQLKAQMEELQEQINSDQNKQASRNSTEINNTLTQMQQTFQKALENVQQQNKQNVQKKMLSAAKKMLQLSHEQEKIQQRTKDTSQLNDDIQKRGREQAQIKDNLQKLMSDIIEISKETFFMDPKIISSLANAHQNMQNSMNDISERQTSPASTKQQKAMEFLNRSINSMQSSMEQMSGSNSGTGFEQFLQQLKQMASSQGSLNDETLKFMQEQGNEGQMSLSQQGQKQRMAAQQQALKQALQEMNQQMGNRSDILGRLNEMGEDMGEIIQDMLNGNINRTTIDRQHQILSRMLDAQKSVREREYSKKRKAEQPKNYLAKDPGTIKNFEDISQKEIQDALKKALSEGYHSDYQKLIEAYFKALSNEKGKN